MNLFYSIWHLIEKVLPLPSEQSVFINDNVRVQKEHRIIYTRWGMVG